MWRVRSISMRARWETGSTGTGKNTPARSHRRAVGVYRLRRDLGFAVGGLLTGVLADAFGIREAIWAIAALTAASGLVVALRMYETHQPLTQVKPS
jgi:predicted MFS family arabinose efflux permease